MPELLAVPNVSTAGDEEALAMLAEAFGRSARVLDFHTDADHGRSVFTLAGEPGGLAESLLAGAAEESGAELRTVPGMGHDLPPALYDIFIDTISRAVERAGAAAPVGA